MASTPEGKVKEAVKALLDEVGAYYFMPVQTGYGAPGLDFHCIYLGYAFCVETKAPGKKMTKRQRITTTKINAAFAPVFVIDNKDDLGELESWLARVTISG